MDISRKKFLKITIDDINSAPDHQILNDYLKESQSENSGWPVSGNMLKQREKLLWYLSFPILYYLIISPATW